MLKLRRISASHRDAFLERYQGLHAWAVQMTANDQALAEDLLHDLFILFTLSQPDLSRIQNLDNYLYASLRNLHISQLRRATRGRFEQLSVVEYESARLSLHSVGHGRDLIQAQDELRWICQYACARKATANAASVLILRFFHGYYPSEIAKVMRITCEAVHLRLRAARTEAKAYLENSKSLAFLDGRNEPAMPEIFPARFARPPGDFLLELQQTIFQSRSGDCLSREELKELYWPAGGHTAGLAADANDIFHPFWVDNRTGVSQIWTAPVVVRGSAMKNGSSNLAKLDDISASAFLELTNCGHEKANNVVYCSARLKNTSKEPLKGPLKLRVIALRSELGEPRIINADNGQSGPGAVWDFSDLVKKESLDPDESSDSKQLRFQIANPRPFRQGNHFGSMFVTIDARVLGHVNKAVQ